MTPYISTYIWNLLVFIFFHDSSAFGQKTQREGISHSAAGQKSSQNVQLVNLANGWKKDFYASLILSLSCLFLFRSCVCPFLSVFGLFSHSVCFFFYCNSGPIVLLHKWTLRRKAVTSVVPQASKNNSSPSHSFIQSPTLTCLFLSFQLNDDFVQIQQHLLKPKQKNLSASKLMLGKSHTEQLGFICPSLIPRLSS